MGVQDLIFGVVNMLHMLLSSALTLQNMLPLLRWRRMSMLHKKTRKCTKKGHLGLQLDMRYNVALLQSVAAALPKALWHWNFEKRKNWMAGCFPEMTEMIENHKLHEISHVFLLKSKIVSLRSRNAIFYAWVTRMPIEMNIHIADMLWQVPQIPTFCPLASKIIISNSSPLQGRRVNRLPCFQMQNRRTAREFYGFDLIGGHKANGVEAGGVFGHDLLGDDCWSDSNYHS